MGLDSALEAAWCICVLERSVRLGGSTAGWSGPEHLHFLKVDLRRVLGFFHVLKYTTSAWLFLVRMLRDTCCLSSHA